MAKAFSFPTSDIVAAASRRARFLAAVRRHPTSSRPAVDRRAALELIGAEIDRARRYERPVSLLCVPVAGPDDARLVTTLVRDTDRTAPGHRGLVVVLPETEGAGVRGCVERIAAATGITPESIGVASFPEDALTAGRLWELLDERMRPRPAASDRSAVENAA